MHQQNKSKAARQQHGATLVEYALFAALLAVVVIVSVDPLKNFLRSL